MIENDFLERKSGLSIKNKIFENIKSSKFRPELENLKNKMLVIKELTDDHKTIISKELNDVETEKLTLQGQIFKKLTEINSKKFSRNDHESFQSVTFVNCLNKKNYELKESNPGKSPHINNKLLPRSSTYNTNNTFKEDIFEHNETEDSNRTARTLNVNSKLNRKLINNEKFKRRDTIQNNKIPCKLIKNDRFLFDLSKKVSLDQNEDNDFDIFPRLGNHFRINSNISIKEKTKSDYSRLDSDSSLNKIIIQPEEVKNEILLVQKQITNIGEFNTPHEISIEMAPKVKQNTNILLNSSTQYESNKNDLKGINSSPIVKTASKWNKLKNLIRSLKSLKTYETKNLENESDLDLEMKCYKERLFSNTIKGRAVDQAERGCGLSEKKDKGLFDTQFNLLLKINEYSLERKRNFKEEIYKIIVSGNSDAVNTISKLMKKDPDYYLISHKDPKFKYNQHLENGKTLLYSACQEGRLDLVSYFLLERNFDPFVKNKEGESPLGVACRWSYTQIVNLLLKNVDYNKQHIKEVLKTKGLTQEIRRLLFNYLKIKFKNICCG